MTKKYIVAIPAVEHHQNHIIGTVSNVNPQVSLKTIFIVTDFHIIVIYSNRALFQCIVRE